MSDSARRTTKLTEERRLLLQALLEEKGIAAAAAHTIKRINNPGHAPLSLLKKECGFWTSCSQIALSTPCSKPFTCEDRSLFLSWNGAIMNCSNVITFCEPVL